MRGVQRIGLWTASLAIGIASTASVTKADAALVSGTGSNGISLTVQEDPTATFPPSTERSSFGSYKVTVFNGGPSTLNNARLRATLTTPGTEFADANPVQKDAANCTRTTLTTIDCVIGYNGLVYKDTSVFFNINVKTPTLAQAASVSITWDLRPGSGDSTGYVSLPQNTLLDTTLVPAGNNAKVESVVPYAGYFLYTGVNNIPNGSSDQHTSAAKIDPVDGVLVVGAISESVFDTAATSSVCPGTGSKFCTRFSVDVPNADPSLPPTKAEFVPGDPAASTLSSKLVFTLRFDQSAVKFLNINTVTVRYTPDGSTTPQIVNACPVLSDSYVPDAANSPCIRSRTVLSGKYGKDLKGDWEIILYALKNGMFQVD